jgi:hypothetical protein
MFSAPVPCASTFSATVPASGLRNSSAGSKRWRSSQGSSCSEIALKKGEPSGSPKAYNMLSV